MDKQGENDLVSFLMVLAILRDGKLGQADQISSLWKVIHLGGPKQYSIQRKVFPDLPSKSVHHSTDEPELHGIENKGQLMRVHILVSMQWPLKQWLADGTIQFQEIAYKAVLFPVVYLIWPTGWTSESPSIQPPVSHFGLRFWKRKHQKEVRSFGRIEIY